ncbi:MAG TPA: aminoacyl-tRNA hydrolase [Planctomycetota bacterium]
MIPGPPQGDEPSEPRSAHKGPRLVVGLGNPGAEYERTRHNVGFETLDLFAKRLGERPQVLKTGGRRLGEILRGPNGAWALLWPQTFMNLSGEPVAAAVRQLDTEPASILVILDDFHLPLGALRVRTEGSPGGHNGLKSIDRALGTSEYPRLRIGVGNPRGDSVEHVLARFRRSEAATVDETLETASFAAEDWTRRASIEDLQARYNRREP